MGSYSILPLVVLLVLIYIFLGGSWASPNLGFYHLVPTKY
jgi:hypothetical protein